MGQIYIKKIKSLNWSESTLAYGSLITSTVCQLDIDLMIYAHAIFQLTDIMQTVLHTDKRSVMSYSIALLGFPCQTSGFPCQNEWFVYFFGGLKHFKPSQGLQGCVFGLHHQPTIATVDWSRYFFQR